MTQPAPRQGFPPQRGGATPAGVTSGPPVISSAPRRDEPNGRARSRGTLLGLRAGQIVVAQLAVVLVAASAAADPIWLAASGPLALLLLVLAFGRMRRRWLYLWIGQGARYFGRRRSLPAGSPPAALLDLLRPGAITSSTEIDGTPVGVVEDAYGLTAILEAGNTSALLSDVGMAVPALGSLLPAATADQPIVRLQLLLTGIAAPTMSAGSAAAANSYRQLTDGRILAQQRVLIAVHVRRSGGFAEDDLRRTLSSAIRRVRRRLDRVTLPCRALAGDSVLQTIGDLAGHDQSNPVRESWSGVEIGGMRQSCFLLTRWPDLRSELAPAILTRLLTMQGGSTTTALSIERTGTDLSEIRAELVVRLAATSPAALTALVSSLQSLLGSVGAHAIPLDGTQLDALAATLPLGGVAGGSSAILAGVVAGSTGLGVDGSGLPVSASTLGALRVPVGGAGMMLGTNRHGEPVTIRLFRPEPTRAEIVGGLRCAQVLVLRALAVGSQVIVMSGRPHAWEPFLRGVGIHGSGAVTMVTPGRVIEPPPACPARPQLLVIDIGPVGATGVPVVEAAWRTTLLVRDELGQSDLDVLARVDLALLQPLTPNEAYVASAALGLGDSASWLTRIRADMIGVVIGRRTLRWALISTTQIEQQLIGPPTR